MPVGENDLPEAQNFGLQAGQESPVGESADQEAGRGGEEKKGQEEAAQPDQERNPDNGDPAGHVQTEQRSQESEQEKDDQAGGPLHDNDGRRFQERLGIFRAVPDADHVAAEAGRQEIVKESSHQIGFGQIEQRDFVALGPGQDLPAVGADEQAENVEGEGQGHPAQVEVGQAAADVRERNLGGQDVDEEGKADGDFDDEPDQPFFCHNADVL